MRPDGKAFKGPGAGALAVRLKLKIGGDLEGEPIFCLNRPAGPLARHQSGCNGADVKGVESLGQRNVKALQQVYGPEQEEGRNEGGRQSVCASLAAEGSGPERAAGGKAGAGCSEGERTGEASLAGGAGER